MKITALRRIISSGYDIAKGSTAEVSDSIGKQLVAFGYATEASEHAEAPATKKPAK